MSTTNGTPLPPRFEPGGVTDLLVNVLAARQEWFRKFLDPRRDVEVECGHPPIGSDYSAWEYQQLFDRDPIAERVVTLYPKECWQVTPEVYETDDPGVITPFEEAWDRLGNELRGEDSYYKDAEGNPVWHYLQRLDELCGIGHFGLLLIGLDDGLPLNVPIEKVVAAQDLPPDSQGPFIGWGWGAESTDPQYSSTFGQGKPGQPVPADVGMQHSPGGWAGYTLTPAPSGGDGKDGNGLNTREASTPGEAGARGSAGKDGKRGPGTPGKRKLLFLRVFPEHLVQITQYEANPASPRFGQPVVYRITLNDPREYHSGVGQALATVEVHWTRVLHVASDALRSSEVLGAPRMRTVLGRILDLRKLYGGSAEMYWKAANYGLALETNPALCGDVVVDKESIKDEMEQYFNSLQRYMTLSGMTAKVLSPAVVDPSAQIQVQIQAICIQLGCPQRVFMGSERGELASSQDDQAWNDRLRFRQGSFITPRIIVPFIDRLIAMGILPTPCQVQGPKRPFNPAQPGQSPTGVPGTQPMGGRVLGKDGKPLPPVPPGQGGEEGLPPEERDAQEPGLRRGGPTTLADGRAGAVTTPSRRNPFTRNAAPPFPPKPAQPGGGPPGQGKPPAAPTAPAAGGGPKPPTVLGAKPPGPPKPGGGGGPPGAAGGQAAPQANPATLLPEKPRPRGFSVYWPDLTSQSDAEKAQVAQGRTAALAQYVAGGLEPIIPPLDFLTKIMEFTEEEARQMLEAGNLIAEEQKAEEMLAQQESQAMQAQAMADAGLDPDEWLEAQQQQEMLKNPLMGGGKPGFPPPGGGKEEKDGAGDRPPFPPKGPPKPPGLNWRPVANAFCATGVGGGVDPSCSPGAGGTGGGSSSPPSVKFTRHEKSGADERMVMVSVEKLDRKWREEDPGFHLPREGEGVGQSEIRGRREGVKEFLKKGQAVQAPRITLTYGASFTDGRHRFAVLRDMGVREVAVMVHKDELPLVESLRP